MTSRLHFELFMQKLRTRTPAAGSEHLVLEPLRRASSADVGSVRLSHIEAAMKEARADRTGE